MNLSITTIVYLGVLWLASLFLTLMVVAYVLPRKVSPKAEHVEETAPEPPMVGERWVLSRDKANPYQCGRSTVDIVDCRDGFVQYRFVWHGRLYLPFDLTVKSFLSVYERVETA